MRREKNRPKRNARWRLGGVCPGRAYFFGRITMKKITLKLAAATILAATAYAAMGDVLTSWPVPSLPYPRINGIAVEGEYIWLKDEYSEYEDKRVLKCTKGGSLVDRINFPYPAPSVYSYGVTFDGLYLWTIYREWHAPGPFDSHRKYTTTGSYAGGFLEQGLYHWSVGIAWDGGYLWTDGGRFKSQLKYTTAGTLVATFPMTVGVGSDMAYYKRQLWYYGGGGLVYGVTLNGSVVASFPAPSGSCAAVGFDGGYLWTADRNKPQYIYKVDIEVVGVAPASVGKVKALFR